MEDWGGECEELVEVGWVDWRMYREWSNIQRIRRLSIWLVISPLEIRTRLTRKITYEVHLCPFCVILKAQDIPASFCRLVPSA